MHTTVGMRIVTYTPRMLPNIKKKTYLLSRYYTFIHTVAAGRLRNRFCQFRARRRFVTLRRSTVYKCILGYYYVWWFIEHATLSFFFNITVIQDIIFEILLKVNNNYILKFLRFELLKVCMSCGDIITSVFWNYLFYCQLLQNFYDFDKKKTIPIFT